MPHSPICDAIQHTATPKAADPKALLQLHIFAIRKAPEHPKTPPRRPRKPSSFG
jgi:hypothetical protein